MMDLEGHPGLETAEEIVSAADRAASVTRQLLAFSRRQVLAPEILDVQSVVTDINPLIRRLVGENVEIRTQVEASLGLVRVDRKQLEQALLNLIINAHDAMPAGGTLAITMANVEISETEVLLHAGLAVGAYVELAIGDTGVGIEPEARDRIFEPFYTTKGPGKGTGLGLSMVQGWSTSPAATSPSTRSRVSARRSGSCFPASRGLPSNAAAMLLPRMGPAAAK